MNDREGLPFARLMMVLSSMAPLFILLAIKGIPNVADEITLSICLALIVVPTALLAARLWIAKRNGDKKRILVNSATDHREFLLVYLFAMLMPLYQCDFSSDRAIKAAAVAVLFVIFLFYHTNLHYMNIIFALFNYRVFTVEATTEHAPMVILSRRHFIAPESTLLVYRISNTVFIEMENK